MTLAAEALAYALTQLGVTEHGGNNRGPQVEQYLAAVGLPAGNPWCAAWVVACFQEAAGKLGLPCPVPATGSSQRLWERAQAYVVADGIPQPGDVYVLAHSPSTGHVGIVEAVEPDRKSVV